MKYRHHFLVRAAQAKVIAFHSRPTSMAVITPPPLIVRLHHAPVVFSEGDELSFTLWFGPLPFHWLARIENISTNGFTDRQLRGPFAEWIHRHTFVEIDAQTTEVKDEINLSLQAHPLWWLVGMGMRLSLPMLFAYRAWKTRRTLQ